MDEPKSAIDYIKQELKERAAENAELQASLKSEQERLAHARAEAKNRNLFRKIKVVDNVISKKEVERDEQVLREFKLAEEKKMAEARSRRSKEIASKNKKPIAALLSGLLIAGCAAGGFATHSHNVALAADYNSAVSYIMEEDFDKATDVLCELDTDDSEALYSYAYAQASIEDYKGKPEEMLEAISDIEGIENGEVKKQQSKACEEIKQADEIQDEIDSLDLTSVDKITEDSLNEIDKLKQKLEKHYLALLDTEKYDIAGNVLYNIEHDTDAGKLINDIDSLGEVSLDSKEEIKELRRRYDALSEKDKKSILNYSVLTDAETAYKVMKKKEDDRIAAEKKAQEEKEEAERLAAEKAQKEKEAEEAKREEDRSKENYTVYITKSGGKYHFDGCRYLKSVGRVMTQGEALRQGYEPCSNCVMRSDIPSYY